MLCLTYIEVMIKIGLSSVRIDLGFVCCFFFPLNGIQNFMESGTKRIKTEETAVDVVLFDPDLKQNFRNLSMPLLFQRLY